MDPKEVHKEKDWLIGTIGLIGAHTLGTVNEGLVQATAYREPLWKLIETCAAESQ